MIPSMELEVLPSHSISLRFLKSWNRAKIFLSLQDYCSQVNTKKTKETLVCIIVIVFSVLLNIIRVCLINNLPTTLVHAEFMLKFKTISTYGWFFCEKFTVRNCLKIVNLIKSHWHFPPKENPDNNRKSHITLCFQRKQNISNISQYKRHGNTKSIKRLADAGILHVQKWNMHQLAMKKRCFHYFP